MLAELLVTIERGAGKKHLVTTGLFRGTVCAHNEKQNGRVLMYV